MDFEYNHRSVSIKSTSDRIKQELGVLNQLSLHGIFPLDVLVKMLIQVEKGSTTKLILQPCLDFISQQQRLAIYMTPIGTYQILDMSEKKMNDNCKLSYIWVNLGNCEAA